MNVVKIRILLVCMVFFMALNAKNQTIPSDRTSDWKSIYNSFEFEYPLNLINILDFGGEGNGEVDNHPFITDAINSIDDEGGIIFFPPGKYLVESSINLKENIILRGDGSDSSFLIFNMGQNPINCINITSSQSMEFYPILGGLEKESSKLICESSNNFEVAKFAEIIQDNGDWNIKPISWANNSVGQIVRIEKIEGDTIYFNNGLRIDYNPELNPRIRPIYPIEGCGVECLTLKRIDEPIEGAGSNINFTYAANSLVKGVKSDSSVGSHISINYSSNIKVISNYIHHGFTYDGVGTRGYGVTLSQHSGECYIANNIFKHLRHAMMIKTGANGNITAYNYSIEPVRTEPIAELSGDISFHGHFAYSNLYEGNIVQNIIIDHYWGPSGPYNTIFRNRAELFGLMMTTNDEYETKYQNIVGNEISNTQIPYGQYIITGTDQFEFANNVGGNIIPEGTIEISDASYYLDNPPDFWNSNINWPPIGLPNELNLYSIPAKQRYIDGGPLTICNDSLVNSILKTEYEKHLIWPNPTHNIISFEPLDRTNHKVIICDMMGNIMMEKILDGNANVFELDLSHLLKPGMYILNIYSENHHKFAKLIIY